MTNLEFVNTAYNIATTIPTKYQLGGWGQQEDGYYLFDCVCLIKSILWGFDFQVGGHGGAVYASNGVPDVDANGFFKLCTNQNTNFANMKKGDIVYQPGHVGIYIGNGNVVEATTAWYLDKVIISQISSNGTRTHNGIGMSSIYNWTSCGTCPFISYESVSTPSTGTKMIVNSDIGLYLLNSSGTKIGVYPNDTIVTFLANGYSKYGYQYYEVNVNGIVGYMASSYLKIYIETKTPDKTEPAKKASDNKTPDTSDKNEKDNKTPDKNKQDNKPTTKQDIPISVKPTTYNIFKLLLAFIKKIITFIKNIFTH